MTLLVYLASECLPFISYWLLIFDSSLKMIFYVSVYCRIFGWFDFMLDFLFNSDLVTYFLLFAIHRYCCLAWPRHSWQYFLVLPANCLTNNLTTFPTTWLLFTVIFFFFCIHCRFVFRVSYRHPPIWRVLFTVLDRLSLAFVNANRTNWKTETTSSTHKQTFRCESDLNLDETLLVKLTINEK